jgi:hypothetical protein
VEQRQVAIETPGAVSGVTTAPPGSQRTGWSDAIRWPLLLVSALLWLVVGALAVFLATHPFLPLDATIEKDIQAHQPGAAPARLPLLLLDR